MSRWANHKKKKPAGWDYIEPTLTRLEQEMRDAINEPHEGKRKAEALWPVHQINNQRSRYVYDMYYRYKKISRDLYQYCLDNKYADAALIAKWKKPGYARLCSTYAINPKNFNFGGVSICRVPKSKLEPGKVVQDQTTGCLGCATGAGGYYNIFGNKYGQNLADIQIERERRAAKKKEAEAKARAEAGDEAGAGDEGDDSSSSDDDDEASPWLSAAAERKRSKRGDDGGNDGGSGDANDRPTKRARGGPRAGAGGAGAGH